MVYMENLVTQVNLENPENQVDLVDQENLAVQDVPAKMVLMETNITALSVLMPTHTTEILATQEDQENVDFLDLQDHLESLVMMPTAILVNVVKMVNLVGLDNLEMMANLENPAIMVAQEITLI